MKQVFSDSSKVAHIWANQLQDSARNSNGSFYFNGATIYSYGSHFPIASIVEKNGQKFTLFTTRTHSVTTSKHIAIARQANNLNTIYMRSVPIGWELRNLFSGQITDVFHKENISSWELSIKANFAKIASARKKDIYINEVQKIANSINTYLQFFELKAPKHLAYLIKECSIEKYAAYLDKESKRIARDKAMQQKARAAKIAENVIKWRNFEIHRLYDKDTFDFLRYNVDKQRIETSQQIEVPKEIALRFYAQIKAVIKAGGCDGECGQFMNQYEIKEINKKFIHIGCHKIEMKEIENILHQLQ